MMVKLLHEGTNHWTTPSIARVTRYLVLCVCFVDRGLSLLSFVTFGHCVVCSSSFGHCVVCSSSFGHCVVCSSSIYRFWYLQTLLKRLCISPEPESLLTHRTSDYLSQPTIQQPCRWRGATNYRVTEIIKAARS